MRKTFSKISRQLANISFQRDTDSVLERKPSYLKYYILIPLLLFIAVFLYLIPFIFKTIPRPKPPDTKYINADENVIFRAKWFLRKFVETLHDKGEESVQDMWMPKLPPFLMDRSKKILHQIENPAFMTFGKVVVNNSTPECKELIFVEAKDVFMNKYTFRLKKRGRSFNIVTIEPPVNFKLSLP